MGGVLAERDQRLARATPLLDRRTQRVDPRGQILCIQPRAGGTGHHAAAPAACGLSALECGELFSPGQRRTRFGSLPSARLALCASPLLPDATEPFVLRPHTQKFEAATRRENPPPPPHPRTE